MRPLIYCYIPLKLRGCTLLDVAKQWDNLFIFIENLSVIETSAGDSCSVVAS